MRVLGPVVLASVLAACGGEKAVPPAPGTVLTFAVDLEGARRASEVLEATLAVVRERLRGRFADVTMTPSRPPRFEVFVPEAAEERTESIVSVVTAWADLRFRIEVLPDSAYREVPPEAEHARSRRVWPGTEAEFDAWKEREMEVWRAAHAAKPPSVYQPSDPGLRLVKRVGREGTAPADFAVVEEPRDPEERFDGRILDAARVGRDHLQLGIPIIQFEIKAAWQDAFERWTARNVHLPMAMLFDGEYHSAPYIQQPLRDSVQVTLGTRDHEVAQREAQALATALQGGQLPARVALVSTRRVGAREVK
jgi:preprotein translocase subunit SecD